MLLYLWVNKYNHIVKTGFNLNSNYEFNFILDAEDDPKKISGTLNCVKKKVPQIFSKNIQDVKAIIGENGAGKSSLLEILIQNIMTETAYGFDGFLITDKYIFNRNKIKFKNPLSDIKYFELKEISSVDLANYSRPEHHRMFKAEQVTAATNGQVASNHLNSQSIIHYSPLLNLDRVFNSEGLAGSSKKWETNYWHYYDLTTENLIVDDYQSLNSGEFSYFITGESELLAHKSEESRRNIEFLSDNLSAELPFENNIKNVTISLNDFYQRFWESIDRFFKADSETLGKIERVIQGIKEKDFKGQNIHKQLESNLYVSFIYGALKYEYKYKMNFGHRGESNAMNQTIEEFLSASGRTRIHKSTLANFLKTAKFAGKHSSELFLRIKKTIDFILTSKSITGRYSDGFSLPINSSKFVKEFFKLIYNDFVFGEGEDAKSFIFHVFLIDFNGLSSGEKNILSMFARFKKAADSLPLSQKEVVFLLDEPEVTLHPQWQTLFLKTLLNILPKLFPEKLLQIIVSSHSPILISDLPKNHILFLERTQSGQCKVSNVKNRVNTFGANIHSLYADSFFLKDKGGAMGKFAKDIIEDVVKDLKLDIPQKSSAYLKSIIDEIGEPLIQNQLLDIFYTKFPAQRIENVDERIAFLEKELASTVRIKQGSHEAN